MFDIIIVIIKHPVDSSLSLIMVAAHLVINEVLANIKELLIMVAAHLVINEVLANIKELSTGCFIMTIIISNIFTTYRKNGSKSCSFYNVPP
jgi:hypothetical protein